MLSQKKLFIYLSKIYLFNFKFKLNLFIYHKFLILTHLLKRFFTVSVVHIWAFFFAESHLNLGGLVWRWVGDPKRLNRDDGDGSVPHMKQGRE